MATKAKTIDEYLQGVSPDQRAALEGLRHTIRLAAPGSAEVISYGLPAFRLDGKVLVGFGATTTHCALYLFSGSTVAAYQDELQGYDTSKGAIRFQAEHPLPSALVEKLVKTRIAENRAAAKKA